MFALRTRDRLTALLGQQRTRWLVLQSTKAALAAVVAWEVSRQALDLPVPYLAPWSALLTVQATVYRSVRTSATQVLGSIAGIVLAFVGGHLFGVTSVTLAVVLFVAVLIGHVRMFGEDRSTPAVAALFALTLGYIGERDLLMYRVADIVVGVVVALAVNMVFVPPLTGGNVRQSVVECRQRFAGLLRDIANGLREDWDESTAGNWLGETIRLDDEVDSIWRTLSFAEESSWWNPRRWIDWKREAALPNGVPDQLAATEQSVAELRSVLRTLWEQARVDPPDEELTRFTQELAPALELLANLVEYAADTEPRRCDELLDELRQLLSSLRDGELVRESPTAASVLMSIRNAACELADAGAADTRQDWMSAASRHRP